jgi:acylglycerol lipase
LGGLNAFRYVIEASKKRKLSGLILNAPAFGLESGPSHIEVLLGSLACLLTPSLTIQNRLNPEDISRIPEQVEKYKSDPLIHHRISLQTAKEMIDFQGKLLSMKEISIGIPLLVCHGTADKITSYSKCKEILDKVKSDDQTFIPYEGAFHCRIILHLSA